MYDLLAVYIEAPLKKDHTEQRTAYWVEKVIANEKHVLFIPCATPGWESNADIDDSVGKMTVYSYFSQETWHLAVIDTL